MKGLRLLFVVVAAAAALSLAGASARAAGECRAQSPGVPGPSYVYFAVGSTKLDAKAKQDDQGGGGPREGDVHPHRLPAGQRRQAGQREGRTSRSR